MGASRSSTAFLRSSHPNQGRRRSICLRSASPTSQIGRVALGATLDFGGLKRRDLLHLHPCATARGLGGDGALGKRCSQAAERGRGCGHSDSSWAVGQLGSCEQLGAVGRGLLRLHSANLQFLASFQRLFSQPLSLYVGRPGAFRDPSTTYTRPHLTIVAHPHDTVFSMS